MKKVLFLIHDLGPGGAEKVLVNLVNNMDKSKFDITVMSLFDVGINKQFLSDDVKYKYCFKKMIRGNSHLMKFLSPSVLHNWLIKDKYDIEVAYLEGPCARIISGCNKKNTKLYSWIHIEQHTAQKASASFRSIKEAEACYNKFNRINCVSKYVMKDFKNCLNITADIGVVYNTNESERIIQFSRETVDDIEFCNQDIKLVGVGKLLKSKGFDRVSRIVKKLVDDGYPVHFYILGSGEEEDNLKSYIIENDLENNITLLDYQTNPYKYISKCDLFVCASFREGFSTATTEALILGIPVCTVDVSGMKEMLGENNEYGIVTENNDEELFKAIKSLISNEKMLEHYAKQATERGLSFSTSKTVQAVESMFIGEH